MISVIIMSAVVIIKPSRTDLSAGALAEDGVKDLLSAEGRGRALLLSVRGN